jgi:hypothetical protein
MRTFFATVLSVIAAGVMLIAYGLLSPRAAASDLYPSAAAQPELTGQQIGYVDDARDPRAMRANEILWEPAPRRIVRPAVVRYTSARPVTTRIARSPPRDWAKTAMVIGGTTATGAGLGAIFGGKKGALIGAALGGGAGTLWEVQKR